MCSNPDACLSITPRELFEISLQSIDSALQQTPYWKIVAGTAVSVALGTFCVMNYARSTSWNWEKKVKWCMRLVPMINAKVVKECASYEKSREEKLFKGIQASEICKDMPDAPWTEEQILGRLESAAGTMKSGKNTGACYMQNERLDGLLVEVFKRSLRTNTQQEGLNPLIRQLEAEIVSMTAKLFKGDHQVCGTMTSGGTDSIMHAVLTARLRAEENGLAADWEMVVPTTRHPAFAKAAKFFGIKLIEAAVHPHGHPKAFQVDLDAIRSAINSKTILVVGSLPGYPHGVIDDIEAIAHMLEAMDPDGRIGLHVDACLGGFVIPWMAEAGYGKDLIKKWGFNNQRVTSISADTHKYGGAEKGSSVVMYRNYSDWKRHQNFLDKNWSGGIYGSAGIAGSRPGMLVAMTWAALVSIGKSGYLDSTKKIIQTTREVICGIQTDDLLSTHLEILGDPKVMVVAFAAINRDQLNIYDVHNEMAQKGWYLADLQSPPGLHFCLTAVHGENPRFAAQFLNDLKDSLSAVLQYPPEKKGKSSGAKMYSTNQSVGNSMFLKEISDVHWEVGGRVEPQTYSLKKS